MHFTCIGKYDNFWRLVFVSKVTNFSCLDLDFFSSSLYNQTHSPQHFEKTLNIHVTIWTWHENPITHLHWAASLRLRRRGTWPTVALQSRDAVRPIGVHVPQPLLFRSECATRHWIAITWIFWGKEQLHVLQLFRFCKLFFFSSLVSYITLWQYTHTSTYNWQICKNT